MTESTIRPATAGDTPAILSLIAASYRRENDAERARYWQWKHEANPFGRSPCLVAESSGRIVGVRAFLRWSWHSGTESVRAVRAVDTATHPDWRGQGVFSRLTTRLVEEVQREGVRFVYNTPNAQSMPGYLKMGWARVTRIPLWVRPIRFLRLARHASGLIPPERPAIAPLDGISHVLNDRRVFAFLSDIAIHDERYHTARTPTYLRWRYAQVPGLSYRARFDTAGGAGALVIARSRMRGRLREVTISDLLVTPGAAGIQVGQALVSDLVRTSDADYVAACAARGTAERAVLARAGFLPAPRLGPHFTVRRLDPAGPDPSRWASWRCSIGDLELF